jgi:hypothetical protein
MCATLVAAGLATATGEATLLGTVVGSLATTGLSSALFGGGSQQAPEAPKAQPLPELPPSPDEKTVKRANIKRATIDQQGRGGRASTFLNDTQQQTLG